jgi:hypothetical protein
MSKKNAPRASWWVGRLRGPSSLRDSSQRTLRVRAFVDRQTDRHSCSPLVDPMETWRIFC